MAKKSTTANIIRNTIMLGSAVAMGISSIHLFGPQPTSADSKLKTPIVEHSLRGSQTIPSPDIHNADTELGGMDALTNALSLFKDNQFEQVISIRNEMDKQSVDAQLLSWLLATSGNAQVSPDEIRHAQETLTHWPGQSTIKRNLERAMTNDGFSAVRLRLMLGDDAPQSFQAAFAIARTYLATRNLEKARALIIPYWHDGVLSASDEARVIETFKETLTIRDHEIRFFNMMSRERLRSGERIAEQMGWQKLHSAWSSVIRKQKSAVEKMEALTDADKKSAAYAFMQIEHYRKNDQDNKAIELLDALPDHVDFLINPKPWWDERRIISRHKFETGDVDAAYNITVAHKGGDDATQIDAAFHAGWYALRGLKDREKAQEHFKKITRIAKGKISKARGYYWLGRALGETEEARRAFEIAAMFNTTFYGQLALAELGAPPPKNNEASLELKSDRKHAALVAAERLIAAGENTLARKLYLSMGWSFDNPKNLKAAAKSASQNDDYFAALKIAKAADWRGIDVGDLTHPVGAISDATGIAPIDHALAYAIARQESEFNVAAVSKANARGLLQILPGTAKEMSRRLSLDFQPSKLTTDANYNARLGVAYLNQQLSQFDGSYILTFAAYNAGPSRAKQWIARFGDPRGKKLHQIVDWIEMIPFPETRSYVQRVMENLQVYKMKLNQNTSIEDDLRLGKNVSN